MVEIKWIQVQQIIIDAKNFENISPSVPPATFATVLWPLASFAAGSALCSSNLEENNSEDSKINLVPQGFPSVRILKPESLVNEIDMRHQSNNQSQQISLISQSSTERPSCAYYQFSEHSPVGHASHQKSGRETNSPNRALVAWKEGSGVKLLMLTLYRDHRQCDRFLQLH